jgi:hypothetical protein
MSSRAAAGCDIFSAVTLKKLAGSPWNMMAVGITHPAAAMRPHSFSPDKRS